MLSFLLSLPMLIIYVIIISTVYVHFRGRERLTFLRQITDHSTFFAPINLLMYLFSKAPATPFIDTKRYPELNLLEDNWTLIRDEAIKQSDQGEIKSSDKRDDAGFNSFFKTGWTRFYLKWYGKDHTSAQNLCPETLRLLAEIPAIKAAMFAFLPAGAKLVRHRDPFAGSLRYHLGLLTPNSKQCQMVVDGEIRHWQDGQSMMFDETYLHYADNQSGQDRLILLCDYERPLKFGLPKYINKFIALLLMRAAVSPNQTGDKTGWINRLFSVVYYIRIIGKKIKTRNKPLYIILKYLLIFTLIYILLFSWA